MSPQQQQSNQRGQGGHSCGQWSVPCVAAEPRSLCTIRWDDEETMGL